jgi:hypothetical protein
MHVRFADRLTDDGTVRCTACSHEVVVRGGEVVPRCYCGGHEFVFHATKPGDPSHASRAADVAHGDEPEARRDPPPG